MTTTITCDRCSEIIEKAISPARFVANRILDQFSHDNSLPTNPDLCDQCARYLHRVIQIWWEN